MKKKVAEWEKEMNVFKKENIMADIKNNSEVLNDIRKIIEQGRHQAYDAADKQL